jgi:ABC-type glycerol-3-phosphate transport system substrate-binding protein
MKIKLQKFLALMVVSLLTVTMLSGCFRKTDAPVRETPQPVEIVYYKLFDGEDVMRPLIQKYVATHPLVTIKYRKFDDQEDYYRTILNELAEGEGPDIFSVPNYWIKRNARKITPLDPTVASPKDFADTFVAVAEKDLVFADPRDGVTKIFALPLTVDTLALYYNKSLYEDRIPSRGRPAETWEEFKEDVFQLTKADNSFERFELAGTAIGRSDNIARAVDILYLMMLQYKVKFYNDALNRAEFSKQSAIGTSSINYNPATEALKLYTSFGLASQKNYTWNEYMADAASPVKEIEAFARGKVATIFGYSYLYEQIKEQIEELKKKNVPTIDPGVIRVSSVPQVNDPATSTEKRDAYANYFVETVGRNTEHPEVAWDFLMFISSKDNIAYYNEKTRRPTSRRDQIEEQIADPIYGVFAEQVGYAESLLIYDWQLYADIFGKAISDVISTTVSTVEAVRTAENSINLVLPVEGIVPAAPPVTLPR